MLTDIFAIRYEDVPIFKKFGTRERRVLHQGFTVLEEFHPYWSEEEKKKAASEEFWEKLHKKVSNELGLRWLSEPYYQATIGLGEYKRTEPRQRPFIEIVRNCISLDYEDRFSPDAFVKKRISLIEVGMRLLFESYQHRLSAIEASSSGSFFETVCRPFIASYEAATEEINIRFQQGRFPLHYHNGFVQLKKDELTSVEIEQPFWSLVSEPIWANVDLDMKEAFDQLDTGGKDPAFHAGKALESVIKIISAELEQTSGRERGAHSFIDNIGKQAVGFISSWEAEELKHYFTNIRNPLGHGPGNKPMPNLDYEQSRLAIEVAMSWSKLLVERWNSRDQTVSQ